MININNQSQTRALFALIIAGFSIDRVDVMFQLSFSKAGDEETRSYFYSSENTLLVRIHLILVCKMCSLATLGVELVFQNSIHCHDQLKDRPLLPSCANSVTG